MRYAINITIQPTIGIKFMIALITTPQIAVLQVKFISFFLRIHFSASEPIKSVAKIDEKSSAKIKQKITRAKKELEQNNLEKVSLSDPESRVMQHAKKYSEPCYNTQFSVTKNQIIIANDVCQDGHDAHQFIPQMKNVKENVKWRKETKVGVDCGYSDGINIKFAEDEKLICMCHPVRKHKSLTARNKA